MVLLAAGLRWCCRQNQSRDFTREGREGGRRLWTLN